MSDTSLLTVVNNDLVFSNSLGYKITFPRDVNGYGHADIKFRESIIADTEILVNRRVAHTRRNYPYHEVSSFGNRLTAFEILENNEDKSVVRFFGESGYLNISVKVTFTNTSSTCSFDYMISADHPFSEAAEIPYSETRFYPEGSKLLFVQYPMQTPVTCQEDEGMDIVPEKYLVPFMFGTRKSDESSFTLGLGYHLGQEYWKGRINYINKGSADVFRIYPVGEISVNGRQIIFSTILSFAETQSDCIAGYRKQCGFTADTPFFRTTKESETLLMSVYRDCEAYVEGKGYHQQMLFKTGTPPAGGVATGAYGKFIPVCANVALAHNLYKWWTRHPEDKWAKDRAIEMVEFFMKSQRSHGGVPNLYLRDSGNYLTYVQYVKEKREELGKDSDHFLKGYFLYTTHMMSMAAYFLYRLYTERKLNENVECTEWKESSLKAMNYLMGNIRPDGMVGRNFTEDGQYDDICANVWLLIALDYFHSQTGDRKYAEARDRMEGWVQGTFSEINHWYNWSADGGFWLGDGFPPINHDAFEIPTYSTFCIYRYIKTQDGKYMQRAKDSLEYLWLCMIPIQYPDYKHLTKGLVKEQDTYSTYDVPFNTTRLFDCMSYLSIVTGDRFYYDFYKYMLQVQMAYQAVEHKFPAFYIGLDWKEEDTLGEEEVAYISEFAGCILIESINSPYCYQYLGGEDWCSGLDYEPQFIPDFENSDIHVAYSTCKIISYSFEKQVLLLNLDGEPGKEYTLGLKWCRDNPPADNSKILLNEKEKLNTADCFNPLSSIIEVRFTMNESSGMTIKIL